VKLSVSGLAITHATSRPDSAGPKLQACGGSNEQATGTKNQYHAADSQSKRECGKQHSHRFINNQVVNSAPD